MGLFNVLLGKTNICVNLDQLYTQYLKRLTMSTYESVTIEHCNCSKFKILLHFVKVPLKY